MLTVPTDLENNVNDVREISNAAVALVEIE
jgi:hypothetical protein